MSLGHQEDYENVKGYFIVLKGLGVVVYKEMSEVGSNVISRGIDNGP